MPAAQLLHRKMHSVRGIDEGRHQEPGRTAARLAAGVALLLAARCFGVHFVQAFFVIFFLYVIACRQRCFAQQDTHQSA